MRVDASEKRMRRDGCFKLAAVRFNRMQLGFTHCCLLFEQSLAWNCRMRFLFYSPCRDRSCRLILSGRPKSPASSFTSMEPVGELTPPVRPRKTSHNGALLFRFASAAVPHWTVIE